MPRAFHFKHAPIQEAASQAVLQRTRQRHQRHMAQVLEVQFPDTAATQPELLAHHYTEAGEPGASGELLTAGGYSNCPC